MDSWDRGTEQSREAHGAMASRNKPRTVTNLLEPGAMYADSLRCTATDVMYTDSDDTNL